MCGILKFDVYILFFLLLAIVLSVCLSSFGHCIVCLLLANVLSCLSSIYGFQLPLCIFKLMLSNMSIKCDLDFCVVFLYHSFSFCPFSFWLLFYLYVFELRLMNTAVASSNFSQCCELIQNLIYTVTILFYKGGTGDDMVVMLKR